MKTSNIYNLVRIYGKIKCSTICKYLNMKQSTVSNILTQLKHQGLMYNKDAFWYINSSSIVEGIKSNLLDVNTDVDNAWSKGYISGLYDYDIINEYEFKHLMIWIKQ